jgi:hypothetical protein
MKSGRIDIINKYLSGKLIRYILCITLFFYASFLTAKSRINGKSLCDNSTNISTLYQNFKNPDPKFGPWVYWFWFDNVVSKEEISLELKEMAERGVAGVELRCVSMYGFAGESPGPMFNAESWEKIGHQKLEYFSPEFIDVLGHALSEAKRLNLKFSLNPGMGWPPGGKWITDQYRSKHLLSESFEIQGNRRFEMKIDLTKVLELNVFAWPVIAEKMVDDKGYIDISKTVDSSGQLTWTVPSGKWLVGIFKTVPGGLCDKGEGPEVDPASKEAVLFHFNKLFSAMDTTLSAYYGNTLVDIATDSWEYERRNKGGWYWSPQILKKAPDSIGYELNNKLYALLGYGPEKEEIGKKIEEVENNLIVNNYFATIKEFLQQRGLMHRPQIYGRGLHRDFFETYTIADVCEVEEKVYIPEAIWVSRLTDKPIISCESFTFAGDLLGNLKHDAHQGQSEKVLFNDKMWKTTPEDLKKLANAHYARGINRIQIHSFSYSPPEIPYPGWRMYAEIHLNRNILWWGEFKSFNTWIARNQLLLQSTKPVTDVLVYPARSNPPDGPFNKDENIPRTAMNSTDGADAFLLDLLVKAERTQNRVKNVVIIDDVKTQKEVEDLVTMLKMGIPLFCSFSMPEKWSALVVAGKETQQLLSILRKYKRKGLIVDVTMKKWQDVATQLQSVQWNPEYGEISYQHFKATDGHVYFISAWDKGFSGELTFNHAKSPEIWDAETGERKQISPLSIKSGKTTIKVDLTENQSCFIVFQQIKTE